MSQTRRDQWAEARRLVVCEQFSYAEAAEAAGVPLSTLQKRAAAERWQDQQDASFGYGQTIRRLKTISLKKALEQIESAESAEEIAKATQLLYAWQKTEQAYPEHRYTKPEADPRVKLAAGIETLEDLVAYLEVHDRSALMALQPHIRPFAEQLEAQHAG